MPEKKLGKYRLLQLLATGGMGEVFLARQEGPAGFQKSVVVKRILRHLADDQGFIDMFLNEARVAAQIQHPNVVQIFGLEHEDDEYFIAMEYVHGRSLRVCLDEAETKGMRFPPRIAARITEKMLRGLHYAHRLTDEGGKPLHILHRDVSPDNVLVAFSGAVKLLDFGIAKATRRQNTVTRQLKGKFPYMAPEQFIQGNTVDARLDVYAAGVTLHELLTGELPQSSPKNAEEATKARERYRARDDLPAAVNLLLEIALEPDPKRRYTSAEEFAQALDGYLNESGGQVSENDISRWLEELFGRDAAMTNPSVVTMSPLGTGPLGTEVLPAMPLSPNTLPEMSAVVMPTAIVPSLQGDTRADEPPPKAPRVSAPVAMVQKVGWPVVITAAVIAFVALGLGIYAVRLATPDPVVLPETSSGLADAGVAEVQPAPVVPVEEPDAGLPSEPVVETPPDAPKPSRPPKVRKPKPQPGRVTVRVNPWAEVFYNGKSYGVTPLKSPISAPAGNAVFTLKNSQLGVSRKYTVKVPAGGEVLLKADLFKKP